MTAPTQRDPRVAEGGSYPVHVPAIVTKDHAGRILSATPLKAVPGPGCWLWNTALEMREQRERGR